MSTLTKKLQLKRETLQALTEVEGGGIMMTLTIEYGKDLTGPCQPPP